MGAPYEKILVLDFESAWHSKEYTLSKMTTEEYIRDSRFKAWGAAFKFLGEDKAVWYGRKDLPKALAKIDWSTTAVLAHNAQFDATILSWVYGIVPCFILDSLSMARALYGVEVGNSLAKLADRFGLPPKGKAVHSTDGILDELPPEVERELGTYCEHDVFLCEEIYKRLGPGFPTKELRLIDMTLRMFVEPRLELEPDTLKDALKEEKEKREGLLQRLAVSEEDLASNDKFADVLRALGVDPPMKKSKTSGEPAFAFAKTDAMFQSLLNGDSEEVALLCEARLKVKSTLERTRAQRFLDIAGRGKLPVPLNYYGAHTGRWSASRGAGLNLQNLKRGSFLRKSILAPAGHSIVVCDLSQIEPRVLAWLADYRDLLQIFSSGEDAYASFGAKMFGIPGLSKESHPLLRQSAKSALLGAGYGLGWAAFAAQLLTGFLGAPPVRYDIPFAKQLGVTKQDMLDFMGYEDNMIKALAIPHLGTEDELIVHCVAAKRIIDVYRETAKPVKDLWGVYADALEKCLVGDKEFSHKCVKFSAGAILLPNGMKLRYPDLQGNPDEKGRVQWTYGEQRKKLYGSKVVENAVQALARLVMTDGMLRVQKRYPVVLTVHDECCTICPDSEVEEAEKWVHAQMVAEPKFMPGIPLDAETGVGKNYGDAKG